MDYYKIVIQRIAGDIVSIAITTEIPTLHLSSGEDVDTFHQATSDEHDPSDIRQ